MVELRCAGIGFLNARSAAEPEIKRVGDHQKLCGIPEAARLFSGELVEGVQRHELDAGLGEHLGPRYHSLHALDALGRAWIAVVERGRHHFAVCIQQHIIDAPRISADAGDVSLQERGLLQANLQFLEQPRDVPMQ